MAETDPVNLWEEDKDEEGDEEDDILISIAASLADIANALTSVKSSLAVIAARIAATEEPPPWLKQNKEKQKSSPTVRRKGPPCPECATPLVERKGPRGPFWGCPKYPKCRGTRNIDQHEYDPTENDEFEEGPF